MFYKADYTGLGEASATDATAGCGPAFRDGTGKILVNYPFENSGTPLMSLHKWTSSTSFSAAYTNYSTTNPVPLNKAGLLFRIKDDGTNLIFYWSLDGQQWIQWETRGRTDFFGSGPTQYGIFCDAATAGPIVQVFSIKEG
jgi:hypothetical protein